jgi:hypothetical protein
MDHMSASRDVGRREEKTVLFCRLYFAATSGVCLIYQAPLVFQRNYIRNNKNLKKPE